MAEESNIFDGAPKKCNNTQGFHDFKLLRTTANASLFLAFKAGKRFLIKTTKDNSEQQNKMLHREYELSIGCDHPHLIHIYTIEESLPFGTGLVMEYIEGRTLNEYLAENPSKKERNRIFAELLSAVGYLHKRGVIHNDLKPENILITHADNSLKLIDFGLADSNAEYAMRTLGCTPHYASPELQERNQNIDARSDIYSIGIIMQELLGESAISRRCIKQNPDKRYPNIYALQQAWRNRHNLYYALAATISLLIFIIPTILYSQTKVAEHRKVQQQSRLLAQVEQDITAICERTKDSIRDSRYSEFSILHITLFREECSDYMQKLYDSVESADLVASLATRFNRIFEKQWSVVVNLIHERQTPSYRL